MRRYVGIDIDDGYDISIHAPLTGCDSSGWRLSVVLKKFQSTHPLRDATRGETVTSLKTLSISIHAPLTGCDFTCTSHACSCFISIHAPLTGCDIVTLGRCSESVQISIHAPLTGCDLMEYSTFHQHINFNPRTPYGMRRYLDDDSEPEEVISIHAPLTGCD